MKNELRSRLVIGGASLNGLPIREVFNILDTAFELGIREIDTAPLYGDSEFLIGKYMVKNPNFTVSTKVGRPSPDEFSPEYILKQVRESISKLHLSRLETVFIHSLKSQDSLRDENIAALLDLKNLGLIKNIGYSGDNRDLLEVSQGPFDSYMCTFNLIDRENATFINELNPRIPLYFKRALANAVWAIPQKERTQQNLALKRHGESAFDVQSYEFRMIKLFGIGNLMRGGLGLFLPFVLSFSKTAKVLVGVRSAKHLSTLVSLERQQQNIEQCIDPLDNFEKMSKKYSWRAIT
jgi:aryl-alcohol dehydrogenase-like predicted oxidoreductase